MCGNAYGQLLHWGLRLDIEPETPIIKTSGPLLVPACTDAGIAYGEALYLRDVRYTQASRPRNWPLKRVKGKTRAIHPWPQSLVFQPIPG